MMSLRDRYAELPDLEPEMRRFLSALLDEIDRLDRRLHDVEFQGGDSMDE